MAETTGVESRTHPVPAYREEEYRERLESLLRRHDQGDDTRSIALVSRDEELHREIQFFRDRHAGGMSVIEALVRNPPAMPDWSVLLGIPKERCREIMRGTMILNHPDAEAFALSLYRDERVSEVLVKYEKEKWLYTRACIVAGEVGYTWLSGALYQALGHEDPEINCGAAEGLAGLGEKRAFPVCMRLAEAEPSAYFRIKLVGVLGRLGTVDAIPRVQALQAQFDGNENMRTAIDEAVALLRKRVENQSR